MDPDGDDLALSASVADAAVASARTSEAEVTVSGVGPGETTVTVTATDPAGLAAEISFEVVVTAEFHFDDHFSSEASLDDWEPLHSTLSVADGYLHVVGDRVGLGGHATHNFDPSITIRDYSIRVVVEHADSTGGEINWQLTGPCLLVCLQLGGRLR